MLISVNEKNKGANNLNSYILQAQSIFLKLVELIKSNIGLI